jgi:hypothetical protein
LKEAQDRPLGSSALPGAYDTFYGHKKEDETYGSIKITIDRDGLGGKEIPFAVELYDTGAVNEDGELVLVSYLEAAAAPVDFTFRKANAPKPVRATETETEALRALDKAIKEHGLLTPEGARAGLGQKTKSRMGKSRFPGTSGRRPFISSTVSANVRQAAMRSPRIKWTRRKEACGHPSLAEIGCSVLNPRLETGSIICDM